MSGVRTSTWALENLRLTQTWRRRRDGFEATVKMLHRADLEAEMVPVQTSMSARPSNVMLVPFGQLRRQWELVP